MRIQNDMLRLAGTLTPRLLLVSHPMSRDVTPVDGQGAGPLVRFAPDGGRGVWAGGSTVVVVGYH